MHDYQAGRNFSAGAIGYLLALDHKKRLFPLREICFVSNSPSCYIVSLILNIDNWPCLGINNFQRMNQTRSMVETSTLVS